MKILNNNAFRFVALLMVLGLAFSACTDMDNDYEVPDDMKRFRPVRITGANGETAVTLTWPVALFTDPGQVNYKVQISQDSLFSSVTLEKETVATTLEITDEELEIQVEYFARVRALGLSSAQDSEWQRTMEPFQITGEQIFLPTFDNEIGSSTILLRWRPTSNPTSIVVTDAMENVTTFTLTDSDREAAHRVLEGLTPLMAYTAEIFEGTRTKGSTSFVMKEESIFDIVIGPGDNFRSIIEDAEDGSIIGLQAGTYDVVDSEGAFANLRIMGKTITLQSVSGDPLDTKVNFRELTFTETGAGITVNGITFDGGPGGGSYFLNFAGGAAQFTDIIVENCIVENVGTSFFRANRAGNNEHKVGLIKVSSTILRNHAVDNYHVFHLDKLEFQEIEITNSTFSALGSRGFIGWATNLTMSFTPKITVNNVSINGLGSRNRNDVLLDCNNNLVEFSMRNSILTNMPFEDQTVGSRLVRANPDSQILLSHMNMFNLTTGGAEPEQLTLQTYVQISNILNVDLGWNSKTTTLTLPAASPLRTASTTGGPIGDPRWAF
ncbi:SusE domain-containing protein [Belliella marina]|uniref:SusE domain-containing protein n=1 Tax=Belliella marina TaxID=1644146 RepID=A0ABW4VIX5_9BACT